MPATIHMICGSTGAGKTTAARRIGKAEAAALFSIDAWMMGLFGADAPSALTPGWIGPRVRRCEDQIAQVAFEIGALGTSSVLDLGFQGKAQRRRWAEMAATSGLAVKVHVLDVSAVERWRRVEARNATPGDTYSLKVSRPMFDYIETTWELPSQAEITLLEGYALAAAPA